MNYRYALNHGPDMTHPLRETDLKVRLRMVRKALPLVPVGRPERGPEEARA